MKATGRIALMALTACAAVGRARGARLLQAKTP
jgi:hypothetical protein